jgi:protein-disulfide isomerase
MRTLRVLPLALVLALAACQVQTGPLPEPMNTASGETAVSSDAAMTSAQSSSVEVTAADPAATTTDSLEVPSTAETPAAVTGHLLISTIGFGKTPCCEAAASGPPRMLEFFDYDCEYCRQHALEERGWIDEKYVAPGKIGIERFYLTHTAAGKRMAQAALCAASQNMFTEMDAYLLENVPRTDPPIFAFAKTLKMDQKQFGTCMENMAVYEDRYELAGDKPPVTRVPTFILGADHRWEGILPRTELEKMIDDAIRN